MIDFSVGEPCPKICRTCNEAEFENLFLFGDELDDGATFVQLSDCGHIIHAESMDDWVMNQVSDHQAVKLPECPRFQRVVNCQPRQKTEFVLTDQLQVKT